jgi:hypothetical protein
MMQKRITRLLPLLLILSLTGCGSIAGIIGASPIATQILNAVSITTTTIDATRIVDGKKTINEEILSEVTNKDCKFSRILDNEFICKTWKPYSVKYPEGKPSEPYP